MAVAGVPRVRVAVIDPSSLPAEIEIVTNTGIVTQSLVITARPVLALSWLWTSSQILPMLH